MPVKEARLTGLQSQTKYEPTRSNTAMKSALTQDAFNLLYQYKKPGENGKRHLRDILKCSPVTVVYNVFPILVWLPKYKWRSDFINDLVSGITVAIMHIPQGMAYALLGCVPPVVGIYMAFFPVLLYVLMGTSRHISMGTFAVVCMMTGNIVIKYSTPPLSSCCTNATDNVTTVANLTNSDHNAYTPIQVATAVCFIVGIWQLALGLCRLGIVSVLLSETLVSGFTTGAAIHVATSQMTNLLGVPIERHSGPLKILYTFIDLFEHIANVNLLEIGISAVTMLILILYNELIKPRIGHKLRIPIPVELLAVVIGSLVSYLTSLEAKYGVSVVGDIPTGLPYPAPPPFEMLHQIILDGLVIAIVAFSVNMSMASMFSRKLNYSIDANQELVASGCSNVFGSFFSCIPFAASLSRSVIQQTTGGKTQIASVVSCSLLLLVLLLIGPFFEPLPSSVLAAIVVVALKSLFLQVTQLPGLWRASKMDGLVWLATFVSVILLDIDYGLGIGIACSLLSLVVLGQRPAICQLGYVPNTSTYLDMTRYQTATPTTGICILQVAGGLHFANCQTVQKKMYSLICVKPKSSEPVTPQLTGTTRVTLARSGGSHLVPGSNERETLVQPQVLYVILSMEAVSFVDPSAIKTLSYMYKDLMARGYHFCLAACPATVYEKLVQCNFFLEFPIDHAFATIHDAVAFAQQEMRDVPLLE